MEIMLSFWNVLAMTAMVLLGFPMYVCSTAWTLRKIKWRLLSSIHTEAQSCACPQSIERKSL